MKIALIKETQTAEQRVGLSPDIVKKFFADGHTIIVEKDAGKASGYTDNEYELVGAKIAKDIKETVKDAEIVVKVGAPTLTEVDNLPDGCHLIALLKPHANQELLLKLAHKNISSFALEMIPRISRAQAMDVLSSQSNLAGYQAVIDTAAEFGRAFPLMMTAAGTVPPARVLIIGAGVAGLQAIATARRLGAIVSAFDVRAAAKEQVESLGALFVEVEAEEAGEGAGGYAKEMSEEYKKRQAERLAEVLKTQDIVITTAQIPGKNAPLLITKEMVKAMKNGAIIYDLAMETGGNCEDAERAKTITTQNGVKIIGHINVPSRIAHDASHLFARNVQNFLKVLMPEGALNWEDEIVKATALTHQGHIIHPQFKL